MARKEIRLQKSLNFIKDKFLIGCIVLLFIVVGYLLGKNNNLFLGTSRSQKPIPTVKVAIPTPSTTPIPTPTLIPLPTSTPTQNPAIQDRIDKIDQQIEILKQQLQREASIIKDNNCGSPQCMSVVYYILSIENNINSQIKQLQNEKADLELQLK